MPVISMKREFTERICWCSSVITTPSLSTSRTASMLVRYSGLSTAMDVKGAVMIARLPTTLSPAVEGPTARTREQRPAMLSSFGSLGAPGCLARRAVSHPTHLISLRPVSLGPVSLRPVSLRRAVLRDVLLLVRVRFRLSSHRCRRVTEHVEHDLSRQLFCQRCD